MQKFFAPPLGDDLILFKNNGKIKEKRKKGDCMIYDRINLKKASMRGNKVGEYKGIKVYSCSKEEYNKNMNSNFYYIIYDDSYLSGRPLVRKNKVIGYVKVDGWMDLLMDNEQWTYIKNELKKSTSFFDSVFEIDKMKSKNENDIDVDEILKSVYAPLEVEDIIIEGLGQG